MLLVEGQGVKEIDLDLFVQGDSLGIIATYPEGLVPERRNDDGSIPLVEVLLASAFSRWSVRAPLLIFAPRQIRRGGSSNTFGAEDERQAFDIVPVKRAAW